MTTLLELEDRGDRLTLQKDTENVWLEISDENERASFNLTKEKARLLIESIQSYFKLDA